MADRVTSARDHVEQWLAVNSGRLGAAIQALKRSEEPSRILVADLETETLFLQICVWEHNFAMDVLGIAKCTGEQAFSDAGPCEDMDGLTARLEGLVAVMREGAANA